MYHDITEPKGKWKNHECWNKTKRISQDLKPLNFNTLDFYNDNHRK